MIQALRSLLFVGATLLSSASVAQTLGDLNPTTNAKLRGGFNALTGDWKVGGCVTGGMDKDNLATIEDYSLVWVRTFNQLEDIFRVDAYVSGSYGAGSGSATFASYRRMFSAKEAHLLILRVHVEQQATQVENPTLTNTNLPLNEYLALCGSHYAASVPKGGYLLITVAIDTVDEQEYDRVYFEIKGEYQSTGKIEGKASSESVITKIVSSMNTRIDIHKEGGAAGVPSEILDEKEPKEKLQKALKYGASFATMIATAGVPLRYGMIAYPKFTLLDRVGVVRSILYYKSLGVNMDEQLKYARENKKQWYPELSDQEIIDDDLTLKKYMTVVESRLWSCANDLSSRMPCALTSEIIKYPTLKLSSRAQWKRIELVAGSTQHTTRIQKGEQVAVEVRGQFTDRNQKIWDENSLCLAVPQEKCVVNITTTDTKPPPGMKPVETNPWGKGFIRPTDGMLQEARDVTVGLLLSVSQDLLTGAKHGPQHDFEFIVYPVRK